MSPKDWHRPLANPEAERLRIGMADLSAELRAGVLQHSSVDGFFDALRDVLEPMPKTAWPRLSVAFNDDQIESKLWLVERLEAMPDLAGSRVMILGAWYGVLAMLMDRLLVQRPAEVQCVDIDDGTCAIAAKVLSILSPPPAVVRADMMELDYAAICAERPTIFINTSCEHLPDFSGWRARIPAGARLVLQNNNHLGCSEHVNCVANLDGLKQQARLSHIDDGGTLPLQRFQRFMIIGRA
jgi:hypothetical protein